MMLATGPLKEIRSSKWVAILGSAAASLTLGLSFLELNLRPANVPDAMVVAALFFQPALLMSLPRRRASLDLAAGVIAAFLGLAFFLGPVVLLGIPQFSLTGLFISASAIGAFVHNSMAPETKGDGKVAIQAVIVTVCALIASGISNEPTCRASAVETMCDDNATSYVGAAATVLTLWLGAALVWLGARRPPTESTTPSPQENAISR
jgi:hypothetical protein